MNEFKTPSVTGLSATTAGYKIMICKYIQHIRNVNLLLLKGLLENQRLQFKNIWLQYQEMCILINRWYSQ